MAKAIVAEWFRDRDVLNAYFDPMLFDRQSDTWATRDDWLDADQRFRVEEFQDVRVEYIRLDLGDKVDETRWLEHLRRVGWYYESPGAEIATVYKYRHEVPDLAREWLAAKPFEDCPGAEWRAREGDWIAARYLADSIESEEMEPWGILWKLAPTAVDVLFPRDQVKRWRKRAAQLVGQQWDWSFADEDLLNAAVVHGWREVGEAWQPQSDYLVHALFHDDQSLHFAAGPVLIAWSRLAPSVRLAQIVGALLCQDLKCRADAPARRIVGAATPEFEKMIPGVADNFTAVLRRHLAVAWTRCRASIHGDRSSPP